MKSGDPTGSGTRNEPSAAREPRSWSEEACPWHKGYPDERGCTCTPEVIARREARAAASPLLSRLRAIARRELDDRTISPGEALDLVEFIGVIAKSHPMPETGARQGCDTCQALAALGITDEEPK